MEHIYLNNKLVAVHVRRFKAGSTPVTVPSGALQLLTLKRNKGDVVLPHRHLPLKRVTSLLQECLIVLKGRIRVDLYDNKKRCFRKISVRSGEALILLGVPHAVHFLKDSLVYELKNGPFMDDKQFI